MRKNGEVLASDLSDSTDRVAQSDENPFENGAGEMPDAEYELDMAISDEGLKREVNAPLDEEPEDHLVIRSAAAFRRFVACLLTVAGEPGQKQIRVHTRKPQDKTEVVSHVISPIDIDEFPEKLTRITITDALEHYPDLDLNPAVRKLIAHSHALIGASSRALREYELAQGELEVSFNNS